MELQESQIDGLIELLDEYLLTKEYYAYYQQDVKISGDKAENYRNRGEIERSKYFTEVRDRYITRMEAEGNTLFKAIGKLKDQYNITLVP